MGFSHSLLSPQAWVFLRHELGGGCIRAELAEGEVCLACTCGPGPPQPGKEGGLLRYHTPPPLVQVRVISKGNAAKNRAQPGVGSGLVSHRGVSSRRTLGELAKRCPTKTDPRLPSAAHRHMG